MTRTKSTYLALIAALLSPMTANADLIFSFEFDNVSTDSSFFNTDGTVTGLISGLVDNMANQTAGVTVEITSFPGLGGVANNGLIASNWDTVVGPGFSVFGGSLTFIFWAANDNSGSTLDQLRLNYSQNDGFNNSNWLTFDGFNTMTGNVQGMSGLRTAAVAVPEPGTLVLLGIGLFGMGLARRRKV